MTEPNASVPSGSEPTVTTTSSQQATPFWEDLMDIFINPAAVFRRRQYSSPWPAMLVGALGIAAVFYFTFPAMQPAFDAIYTKTIPKIMATNPNLTQDQIENGRHIQAIVIRDFFVVIMFIAIVGTGIFTWLIGKLFGAKEGFVGAMVIASYAFLPRILGAVATGIIALLSDPVNMTSMNALAIGPLRFMSPDSTGVFMTTLLTRLDLAIIWETILLGVGIHIVGRVPRGKAVAFAITIWLVGALPTLRQLYLAS